MKRRTFFALAQFVVALAIAFAIGWVQLGSSTELIWLCLGGFYCCAAQALLSPVQLERRRPSYLTGEVLFLVFAYILFFFPYQLAVLGVTELWFNRFVEYAFVEYTNPSLMASTSGVLAFCAGIRLVSWPRSANSTKPAGESQQGVDAFLLLMTVLQFIAVGLFSLSGGLAEMASGAYVGSTTSDRTQDGLYFLTTLFSMIGISGSLYRRWAFKRVSLIPLMCLGLAAAWAVLLLLLGDRNSFLLLALVTLAGCSVFFFRVGPLAIALALVVALLGYKLIEESRQSTTRDFTSVVSAMQASNGEGFAESSFTITTVTSRAAFALVPGSYPYFLGKFKVVGIAGVIPYSRGLFVSPNDPFVTSADLINVGVLGQRPTWSMGTNVISDIYVDFGRMGVPLLMLVAGVSLSFVTSRFVGSAPSLKWSVCYLIAVAVFAELPRYTFDFPIRPLLWTFALIWIFGVARRLLGRTLGEVKQ